VEDNELRGLVLQRFYELRHGGGLVQLPAILPVAPDDVVRLVNICEQLQQTGLINWTTTHRLGRAAPMPITLTVHNHSVTVSGSTNVQIGDANVSNNNINIASVMKAIDQSSASLAQKEEAKSLWSRLTNNPAFAAILGAIATALTSGQAS